METKHEFKTEPQCSTASPSKSQYTNLARHGNGAIKHFKYKFNKIEHHKP